jgi:hypothetical protein
LSTVEKSASLGSGGASGLLMQTGYAGGLRYVHHRACAYLQGGAPIRGHLNQSGDSSALGAVENVGVWV